MGPTGNRAAGCVRRAAAAADGTGVPANEAAPFIGIAPGPLLYGAEVPDANGSGRTSNVIRGVEWCAGQPGVDVINLSLGGDGSSDGKDSLSLMVNNAVEAGGKVAVVAASRRLCSRPVAASCSPKGSGRLSSRARCPSRSWRARAADRRADRRRTMAAPLSRPTGCRKRNRSARHPGGRSGHAGLRATISLMISRNRKRCSAISRPAAGMYFSVCLSKVAP